MNEVYKRLGERAKPLLDEGHRELPIPEQHRVKEPLFMAPHREVGF